jgi:hypothetical protein
VDFSVLDTRLNVLNLLRVPLSFETNFSTPVLCIRENTFGNAKHVIVNTSVKEEILQFLQLLKREYQHGITAD